MVQREAPCKSWGVPPALRVRSPAIRPQPNCSSQSQRGSSIPQYMQNEDLRRLSRTMEVFQKIESEPHMSFSLPRPKITAGRILEHACKAFEKLHSKESPMTFKFGITHCPAFRWHHHPYGYKFGIEKFQHMLIVFASPDPVGAAFLEAALIRSYGSCLA